jgi:hypothetical protein
MFSFGKDQGPKLVTLPQFQKIAGIPFGELYELYRTGRLPIVRQGEQAFVDLEEVAALQIVKNDDE